jgi:hypothetical protein
MPFAASYTYTDLGDSGGTYTSPCFTLLFGKLIDIEIPLI